MLHVVCHVVRRDSLAIKFNRAEITFILAYFSWLKPTKEKRKLEYPEKTPGDGLQEIPHIKAH